KAVHVGHLRNIVLGDATVRILRAVGYPVLAATYPGDIGMHVIKCLWCYLKFYKGEEPATGRGRWLSAIYAESDERLEYRKHVQAIIEEYASHAEVWPHLMARLRQEGYEEDADVLTEAQTRWTPELSVGPDVQPDESLDDENPPDPLGARLNSRSVEVIGLLWD